MVLCETLSGVGYLLEGLSSIFSVSKAKRSITESISELRFCRDVPLERLQTRGQGLLLSSKLLAKDMWRKGGSRGERRGRRWNASWSVGEHATIDPLLYGPEEGGRGVGRGRGVPTSGDLGRDGLAGPEPEIF